jgi:hypothetical protein
LFTAFDDGISPEWFSCFVDNPFILTDAQDLLLLFPQSVNSFFTVWRAGIAAGGEFYNVLPRAFVVAGTFS